MIEKIQVARRLFDLALALLPVEHLRDLLSEQAVKRAHGLADEAERLKFGEPEEP